MSNKHIVEVLDNPGPYFDVDVGLKRNNTPIYKFEIKNGNTTCDLFKDHMATWMGDKVEVKDYEEGKLNMCMISINAKPYIDINTPMDFKPLFNRKYLRLRNGSMNAEDSVRSLYVSPEPIGSKECKRMEKVVSEYKKSFQLFGKYNVKYVELNDTCAINLLHT
jgi:hypothetical protein